MGHGQHGWDRGRQSPSEQLQGLDGSYECRLGRGRVERAGALGTCSCGLGSPVKGAEGGPAVRAEP